MFEGSFDNKNGEQVVPNHGERINYEHPNDTSSTHSSTREYYTISTTTYNINSSSIDKCGINSNVNIDIGNAIFDITYSKCERRILYGIESCNGTLIFDISHELLDVVINSTCFREDETIGIISVRDNVHRLTNTNTDSAVNTKNDNDNAPNANARCNDTRFELLSEDGEKVTISMDEKYASILIIIVDSNTMRQYIGHIRFNCGSATYNATYISLGIVDNDSYDALLRYDWTKDTIVGAIGKPLTSMLAYNDDALHDPEMMYGMEIATASMHTDGEKITVPIVSKYVSISITIGNW